MIAIDENVRYVNIGIHKTFYCKFWGCIRCSYLLRFNKLDFFRLSQEYTRIVKFSFFEYHVRFVKKKWETIFYSFFDIFLSFKNNGHLFFQENYF